MGKYFDKDVIDYFNGEILSIRNVFEEEMKNSEALRKKYADEAERHSPNSEAYKECKHLEFVYQLQENKMSYELIHRPYEAAFIVTISEEELRAVTKDYTTDLDTLKERVYLDICPIVQTNHYFKGYGKIQFNNYQQNSDYYKHLLENPKELKRLQLVERMTFDYDLAKKLKGVTIEYKNELYSRKDMHEWEPFAEKVSQIFGEELSVSEAINQFRGVHLYGQDQLPAAYGWHEVYFQAKVFQKMQKFASERALEKQSLAQNYDNGGVIESKKK